MRIEAISVEEAMAEGTKLPFIFLRNLSSIHVGKMIQEINIEELIEAKCFDKNIEIRIVKYEKQLKAVKIVAEPSDECIYKTYVIQNSNANEIKVACHLEYDEDGQAHIRTRRLVDWRE